MEEVWKDIDGYEKSYQVSNLGNVRSVERIGENNRKYPMQMLKKRLNWKGYPKVCLNKHGHKKIFSVHRLVAKAFIPNPDNLPQVNHKDENKENNNVNNLEWCTAGYNNNYGLRNKKVAKKLGKPVIAIRLVDGKREWYRSTCEAGRKIGTSQSNIWKACKYGKIVKERKIKYVEDEKLTYDEMLNNLEEMKEVAWKNKGKATEILNICISIVDYCKEHESERDR